MKAINRYAGYITIKFDEYADSEEQLQDILERQYGECEIDIEEEEKVSKGEWLADEFNDRRRDESL